MSRRLVAWAITLLGCVTLTVGMFMIAGLGPALLTGGGIVIVVGLAGIDTTGKAPEEAKRAEPAA